MTSTSSGSAPSLPSTLSDTILVWFTHHLFRFTNHSIPTRYIHHRQANKQSWKCHDWSDDGVSWYCKPTQLLGITNNFTITELCRNCWPDWRQMVRDGMTNPHNSTFWRVGRSSSPPPGGCHSPGLFQSVMGAMILSVARRTNQPICWTKASP